MRQPSGLLVFLIAAAVLAMAAAPLCAENFRPPVAPVEMAAPAPAAPQEEGPTVSAPPLAASPAAGHAHLKSGIARGGTVSLSRPAASTVTGYEKGRSITVKTPAGHLVKFRLAKDSSVPEDLSAGRTVLLETRTVKKRRIASRVTYAESRVVMSNVN